MHELALCESILDILKSEAASRSFRRVRAVRLEIGSLACASPDAIAFCFDAVMRDTLADGARLEIVRTESQGWCLNCGERKVVGAGDAACPQCGLPLSRLVGDELRVTELEVE